MINEEAIMVTAQILEATHTVDDRVREVENKVLDVDDKVASVDDRVVLVDERVAGVDERVAGVDERVVGVDERVVGVDNRVAFVDERVAGVGDHVKAIDDKVAVVIDGAQSSLFSQHENVINSDVPRRERDKGNHATSGRRHGSSETFVTFFVDIAVQAKASAQGINYDRTFAGGSLPPIPLSTTTLPVVPIASKQLSGFSKEVSSTNGNPMGHFCGSTENVRSPDLSRPDDR